MRRYISMELLEGLQRVIDHGIAEKDGTHLISAEYLIKSINEHYVVTEEEYFGIETYADVEDN